MLPLKLRPRSCPLWIDFRTVATLTPISLANIGGVRESGLAGISAALPGKQLFDRGLESPVIREVPVNNFYECW